MAMGSLLIGTMSFPENSWLVKHELTMFIYQTKKRELYYERVIALYQQTGYGKKRLGKLFPEIGEKTISRWIANYSYGFSKWFGQKLG